MTAQNPETMAEMLADPMTCSDCGRSHVLEYADPMPGLPAGLYFIPGFKQCPCGSALLGALTNVPPERAAGFMQVFLDFLTEDDDLEDYNNARMRRKN